MHHPVLRTLTLAALVALSSVTGLAQSGDLSESQIQEIIRKFAAKESEFSRERENYTYRQSVRMQEYEEGGAPAGRYEIVSDIIFDAGGKRNEVIVKAPPATLRLVSLSPEDEQDLRNVLPFVLTSKDIDNYHVRYLGKQNADEIPCFVFAVKPKTMQKGQRYFQGMIWVDDRDLQIVKTYGRSTGILAKGSDQAFAKFETFREQIDGKYWFPTYTIAEDTLQFDSGLVVGMKTTVKYENYQRFNVDVRIETDEESLKNAPVPKTPPAKKP